VRRNNGKTNLGLMKNALSFMKYENKEGNDGKVIKAKQIPTTTVTQNKTSRSGSETKS